MEKLITKLYRFDESYNDCELWLQEFDVIKETPKGYWINEFMTRNKWVPKSPIGRYAYVTKKEALIGFIKRKEKYIFHLNKKLAKTKRFLEIAKNTDLSIKLLIFDGDFL